LHRRRSGKQTGDAVVAEWLQAELQLLRRDDGRAGRRQKDRFAVLLAGFDRATRDLPADAVSVDDEAAAVKVRQRRKCRLLSFFGENLITQRRVRRPVAIEVDCLRLGSEPQDARRQSQNPKPRAKNHRGPPVDARLSSLGHHAARHQLISA